LIAIFAQNDDPIAFVSTVAFSVLAIILFLLCPINEWRFFRNSYHFTQPREQAMI
jgi:hypothetical protein